MTVIIAEYCSVPDVPVTVRGETTAVGEALVTKVAPPQPFSIVNPVTPTTNSRSICRRRRLFQLMQQNATARAEPGKSGSEFLLLMSLAVVPVLYTVSVAETGAFATLTEGWEKIQDAPAGKPLQANETAPLNPFTGTTDIVAVPGCAEVTVKDVGEDETANAAPGELMV